MQLYYNIWLCHDNLYVGIPAVPLYNTCMYDLKQEEEEQEGEGQGKEECTHYRAAPMKMFVHVTNVL